MKKILLVSLGLFIMCFCVKAQLKVLSNGNVNIGGGFTSNASTLNLYGVDKSIIYAKGNFSFGWGDVIKSEVYRSDAIAFSAWLNGSRKFRVMGNGDVWSSTAYFYSDSTLKCNIANIQDPLQVLKSLKGVTYFMKCDNKEKKIKHSGLLAQEVEKILPDLVFEDEKGTKAIAYVELIPYLIEAIKIQQQVIDEQNIRIESIENNCCSDNLKSASINEQDDLNNNDGAAELYQNAPNPFSFQTTISFKIPKSVGTA